MDTMSDLKLPGQLNTGDNLSKDYKDWIRVYDIYARASGVAEKSQKVSAMFFSTWQAQLHKTCLQKWSLKK